MRELIKEMAKSHVFLSLQVRIILSRDWKYMNINYRFIKERSRIWDVDRSKYLRHGGFSATPGGGYCMIGSDGFTRISVPQMRDGYWNGARNDLTSLIQISFIIKSRDSTYIFMNETKHHGPGTAKLVASSNPPNSNSFLMPFHANNTLWSYDRPRLELMNSK